jgi:hypothetical protein
MSAPPLAPKLLKGALVAYAFPQLIPTIVVFQYNPDRVVRTLSPRTAAGGGRGDAMRTDGPPEEKLSFTAEIDAADQLEHPDQNATTAALGLHPAIASLERLMYPSFALVVANQVLANLGSAMILGEPAPLALLVWGPARVVPVRVDGLTVTEEAFDPSLNPIRAQAELRLSVLTIRELQMTNPGYWVYLASFQQREVFAALDLFTVADTGTPLPF